MKITTNQSDQELKILKEEYNQPDDSGDSQDQQDSIESTKKRMRVFLGTLGDGIHFHPDHPESYLRELSRLHEFLQN